MPEARKFDLLKTARFYTAPKNENMINGVDINDFTRQPHTHTSSCNGRSFRP